jgi:hypothetical protein
MSKTNDTWKFGHVMATIHNSEASLEVHELKDDELNLVSGGGTVTAGWDLKQNKKTG